MKAMKVSELMRQLQGFSPDAEVYLEDGSGFAGLRSIDPNCVVSGRHRGKRVEIVLVCNDGEAFARTDCSDPIGEEERAALIVAPRCVVLGV